MNFLIVLNKCISVVIKHAYLQSDTQKKSRNKYQDDLNRQIEEKKREKEREKQELGGVGGGGAG